MEKAAFIAADVHLRASILFWLVISSKVRIRVGKAAPGCRFVNEMHAMGMCNRD